MSFTPDANYGRALLDAVRAQIPTFGRVFVVKNANDSADYNYQMMSDVFKTDTEGKVRFFTDLATAYAATQDNNNDVICLDAHTSHKLSSMLTVSTNRVHFMGFDGGVRVSNQRALISSTGTGASTDVSMIKVTGTGCTFRNIKFLDSWTVAQNLSAVLEYGNNTLYKNCTFHAIGSGHLSNANAASLILAGGDTEFVECNIGGDTLQSTVASGQTLLIKKGSSAQAATRCLFKECIVRAYTSQTTHAFVRVAADGDIDREVLFDDCKFLNFYTSSNGAVMAVAIASASGLVSGTLQFRHPYLSSGVTKLATAAVGNAGVYVVGPVGGANTSGIAVQATA